MRIQPGNYYPFSPIGSTPYSHTDTKNTGKPGTGIPGNPGVNPTLSTQHATQHVNPFVRVEPPAAAMFFSEMRQVIGKGASPDSKFSVDDLKKYETILSNAEEFLNDTIAFSERAHSPTEVFQKQKQALEERLGLVKAIKEFVSGDKEDDEDEDDEKPTGSLFEELGDIKGSLMKYFSPPTAP